MWTKIADVAGLAPTDRDRRLAHEELPRDRLGRALAGIVRLHDALSRRRIEVRSPVVIERLAVSNHWYTVLVGGALYLPLLVQSVALALGPDVQHPPPRSRREGLTRMSTADAIAGLAERASQLLVLGVVVAAGVWELDPVEPSRMANGMVLGCIAGVLFVRVLGSDRPVGRASALERIQALGAVWPREALGRCLVVLRMCLSPLYEESIARGILVFAISGISGSIFVGMVVGGGVSLLMHLYQGAKYWWYHILFHIIAALLFGVYGLAGAYMFHMAHNAVIEVEELSWFRTLARRVWFRSRSRERSEPD